MFENSLHLHPNTTFYYDQINQVFYLYCIIHKIVCVLIYVIVPLSGIDLITNTKYQIPLNPPLKKGETLVPSPFMGEG